MRNAAAFAFHKGTVSNGFDSGTKASEGGPPFRPPPFKIPTVLAQGESLCPAYRALIHPPATKGSQTSP